jgi:hypothetical protein
MSLSLQLPNREFEPLASTVGAADFRAGGLDGGGCGHIADDPRLVVAMAANAAKRSARRQVN